MPLLPSLKAYITSIINDFNSISESRKALLEKTATQLTQLAEAQGIIKLTFICTHNSRRSMFGQIWAKTAAVWYGLDSIETYSGGTEATAFNERAVAALQRAGFLVEREGKAKNPTYKIYFDNGQEPMLGFSKIYNAQENPQHNFIAIMTCNHADKNCPIIPGAFIRVALTYSDPKEADGSENEEKIYDERCRQVATEMFYMLACLKE
jgi:protein-tyrosine-phosphatase